MPAEAFLDTNVFIYSFDGSAPAKRAKARQIIRQALEGRGAISTQVVQEFLNVALAKFARPFTHEQANTYLHSVLLPLCEVYPSARLLQDALSLRAETGYGFYDSLIVAGALAAGCRALLTEDLQPGRVIRGLTIENPFS